MGVDLSAGGRRGAGSPRRKCGHADGERDRLLEHRVVERAGGVERERILLMSDATSAAPKLSPTDLSTTST